jgi:hypothetical protein
MYALRSGHVNPDYYSGGTHQLRGEKVPNTSPTTDKAVKYNSYNSAKKMEEKLNEKYAGDYYFNVEELR